MQSTYRAQVLHHCLSPQECYSKNKIDIVLKENYKDHQQLNVKNLK